MIETCRTTVRNEFRPSVFRTSNDCIAPGTRASVPRRARVEGVLRSRRYERHGDVSAGRDRAWVMVLNTENWCSRPEHAKRP